MPSTRLIVAALVVVLAPLQYRLWVGKNSLAHVSSLEDRVEIARAENNARVERNNVLKAEIMDLKKSHAAIEARARVEWGLVKEGETFYLLLEQ